MNESSKEEWVMCNDCGTWKQLQKGNHHPYCGCLSDNFCWEDVRDHDPEDIHRTTREKSEEVQMTVLSNERIEQLAAQWGVIYPCRVSKEQAINFAREVGTEVIQQNEASRQKIKRALDIAEGRLMCLDYMKHPAIPANDDVISIIREALIALEFRKN
jgi:hypothetical protein